MRTAIVNLGTVVTGDLKTPFAEANGILMQDGRIAAIGTLSSAQTAGCDVVIDAAGCTGIPGLIDSHVHITFGDYTPRQRVVGYLESYLHGGTTTAITASEVHVPAGRRIPPASRRWRSPRAPVSSTTARRACGSIRLDHPGAGPHGSRSRRTGGGRAVAGQRRLRRLRHAV